MSGKTLIGKDQLETIVDANTSVLATARTRLELTRDDDAVRQRIESLESTLVVSGRRLR